MSNRLTYPKVVADTATMDRAEWLAMRQRGIGGSDAAAILGVSPWTSRYTLWTDKTMKAISNDEPTDAMRFGTLMEPIVADMFAENASMTVFKDTNLYAHPEHEFMLANLDGLVSTWCNDQVDALLEVKTARRRWDDGVPAYYVSQVQHYMAVTGMEVTFVAALFNGEEFQRFEVQRDETYIDRLINMEAEFWQLVQRHQQPEIDGSESTFNAVRKAYDATSGKATELTPDIVDLIAKRATAKQAQATAEAEVREAEARIMEAMQDAEVGTVDGKSLVTWKRQSRSSLDSKALKEAHPDLVEQFSKSSTFRVLRVK